MYLTRLIITKVLEPVYTRHPLVRAKSAGSIFNNQVLYKTPLGAKQPSAVLYKEWKNGIIFIL